MAPKKEQALLIQELQHTLNIYEENGRSMTRAALVMRIPRTTLQSRLGRAKQLGLKPAREIDEQSLSYLSLKIRRLESELRTAQQESLDASVIKSKVIQLTRNVSEIDPPTWLYKAPGKSDTAFGVPTMLISDLHAGEVVDPRQVNGVNEFNLKIFDQRMETLADSMIRLLNILSPKMDYPGLVLDFAGDNVSGNIHEELTATNELNTMPTVLHLFDRLGSFIGLMADTFKRVHIEWTTGNHGRDTRKIWNKDRHHTSFDWLLGCFLAKHFANDERITFHIPDGPDAYYKIYEYRYCLTHGDQFRSFGDSMIGSLGPIIRGDIKKRSRNSQLDLDYDTLVMGHWHQYIHLSRLIVNGSVKGYDEFSNSMNFPFEKPQQALWLTHPKYGITYRMPVFVDRLRAPAKTNWVSVAG